MKIFLILSLCFLVNCSSKTKTGTTQESSPSAAANTSDRVIKLWDDLSLKVHNKSGKWVADPADVVQIKSSLIKKIQAGKYKKLGQQIKENQLTRAFGKTINFNHSEQSTISFFIGLAKPDGTAFVFPKEINLDSKDQTYKTFLEALTAHVKTVNKDIGSVRDSKGKSALEGYFVVATKEYEIAFMQWSAELKPMIFMKDSDPTKRTGPQTGVLFESNLVWEDPSDSLQ